MGVEEKWTRLMKGQNKQEVSKVDAEKRKWLSHSLGREFQLGELYVSLGKLITYREQDSRSSLQTVLGVMYTKHNINTVKNNLPIEEKILVSFTISAHDSSGHWTSRDNWYNGSKNW